MIKKTLLAVVLVSIMAPVNPAQAFWPFKKKKKEAPKTEVKAPAEPKKATDDKAVKAYGEVIPKNANSFFGMIGVHMVKDKYYFEVPDSIFGRDILVVGRISKAPADPNKEKVGYPGDPVSEEVIRFDRGPRDKVFIRSISYREQSKDSLGLMQAVRNSNLQPIIASFDVKAYGKDTVSKTKSAVIDLTDYIKSDKGLFTMEESVKKGVGVASLVAESSYIDTLKVFPINVEVRTVKTYNRTSPGPSPLAMRMTPSTPLTYELNTSLVLLPKEPMKIRFYDPRVGYFAMRYTDFDSNPQGVETRAKITRWRLEPKPEDVEKYMRGEKVYPVKPIVIYIDPATPKKWIPYLKQGVNDWQKAFEHAGFLDAIYALTAPEDDPAWSMEDARHSVIVYKPSDIANASGPHVSDPRSGEIIETHINWYHNVMELLRNWYMIQAGPIDPRARQMTLPDSLMGELIRFVSSHEVGHTLGLRHNFGSSATVPVEKLRDKAWVEANGHTPSIMDYARFNYVAQPEDNIGQKGIFPRIGMYDNWSIEWGYRWLGQFATPEEEIHFSNESIIAKLAEDVRYTFGTETDATDPRNQSECLGDDAMLASHYGILNLQRIVPNLMQWTREADKDYSGTAEMYAQVVGQFSRYMGHVVTNVGGTYRTPRTVEEAGDSRERVPAAIQKQAIEFLNKELFNTPKWLVDKELINKAGVDPLYYIGYVQTRTLDRMLNGGTIDRLSRAALFDGPTAYSPEMMLRDVKKGVWGELTSGAAPDIYRRNLQKSYVKALIGMLDKKPSEQRTPIVLTTRSSASDAPAIARAHLTELDRQLKSAAASTSGITRAHYQNLSAMIADAFEQK